mgnify:CR=1 FL=1
MGIAATRIKQVMEEKGMTQLDLASKSGVSQSHISRYLNGKYEPKSFHAQKIAEALGVSPVWLMGIEGVDRNNQPTTSGDKSSPDIEKALELYRLYKDATPQVRSAVEILLKPTRPDT